MWDFGGMIGGRPHIRWEVGPKNRWEVETPATPSSQKRRNSNPTHSDVSEIPSAWKAGAPARVAPCFHVPVLHPEAPH